MKNYEAIVDDLIQIFNDHLSESSITRDWPAITEATDFEKDLYFDSVEMLDLVGAVEDHFGILVPPKVLPKMHKVADIALAIQAIKEKPQSQVAEYL